MRYKVVGARSLYIDKAEYKPGDSFLTAAALPNEDSLLDAGHIEILPEVVRKERAPKIGPASEPDEGEPNPDGDVPPAELDDPKDAA